MRQESDKDMPVIALGAFVKLFTGRYGTVMDIATSRDIYKTKTYQFSILAEDKNGPDETLTATIAFVQSPPSNMIAPHFSLVSYTEFREYAESRPVSLDVGTPVNVANMGLGFIVRLVRKSAMWSNRNSGFDYEVLFPKSQSCLGALTVVSNEDIETNFTL